jgi:hypothetical protein
MQVQKASERLLLDFVGLFGVLCEVLRRLECDWTLAFDGKHGVCAI